MTAQIARTLLSTALALGLVSVAPGLATAEDAGSTFTGRFLVGVRTVSVDGSITKFDQHLNLDDGPRLFDLHLDFLADEDSKTVDRVQLDIDHFGGDPFETLRLAVDRHGKFAFRYNRWKSTYFYEDVLLPIEDSAPSLSNAGDFHTFDFDRARDQALLDIELSDATKLHFGFDRFAKHGESTTTLDIQRDEFELDRPIDEKLDTYTLGFEHSWDKVTLILEEEYRDYENHVEIFLPGLSLGEDPEDATILDFFFLDQPYTYESHRHTVRINARPSSRLILRAAGSFENLNLDVDAEESSQGTDFAGRPFTTDFSGGGEIERDLDFLDLDLSYLINDRWAVVAELRRYNLDQRGAFLFADDVNASTWEIESFGVEAGLQYNVSPTLGLAWGAHNETRKVEIGHIIDDAVQLEEEETDHTGYFVRLDWRPRDGVHVDVEAEDSSYDDPFTLASATDRQRFRIQGRYRFENGVYLKGTYLINSDENSNSGWDADRHQLDLRLGYRDDRWEASLGYALAETERSIDQLVTTLPGFGGGVTFDYFVLYESDADFLDGRVRIKVDERLALGGEARLYENEGNFPLKREDLRAFAEISLSDHYRINVAYRRVDFEEKLFHFNDYEADIGELSVGYSW